MSPATTDERDNPLEEVERLATVNDRWFDRKNENEISILVTGKSVEYQICYTWMPEIDALHLACAFELRVSGHRQAEVKSLISLINVRLWVGHFDLWPQDGLVMYRHALQLPGDTEGTSEQYEAMLSVALDVCERYYPAFQFVMWSGKSPEEALQAVAFDTEGEA